MTASKNSERLEKHKRKLREVGFKRLSVWICPELAAMLAAGRAGASVEDVFWSVCYRGPQNPVRNTKGHGSPDFSYTHAPARE